MPFTFPTTAELESIEPELIQRAGREGRLGLDIMPPKKSNYAKVRWEQEDSYTGLQHLRGADGAPTRVSRIGLNIYEYEPGIFGEFIEFTETELLTRAGSLDYKAVPISIDDLVVPAKQRLLAREWDRMESSIWTLLTTGTLKILLDGPDGTQYGFTDTYPIQTYSAPILWSTYATAVPTRNFQTVQQLGKAAGRSVDFGAGATAYMNSVTANHLLNNANAADLAGKRTSNGATFNDTNDINKFWIGQNLPKIAVYDEGYIEKKNGPYIKFIPDGKVVVIGRRPGGAVIGNYYLTRNMVKGGAPGSYDVVIDTINTPDVTKKIPPVIQVHRGHNGGPAIKYPSAVLVMTVA